MANRMLETGVGYNMGLVQAVTDMSYTATTGLKRLKAELDRAHAAETEALERDAEKDAQIKALADALFASGTVEEASGDWHTDMCWMRSNGNGECTDTCLARRAALRAVGRL